MNVRGIELANVGMQTYFDIEFLGPFQHGYYIGDTTKEFIGQCAAIRSWTECAIAQRSMRACTKSGVAALQPRSHRQ
ncbi:hypothetical protein A6J66_000740 [Yersinia enterocolitica]|nr:hypothetical protein A6J66_000740 [Yersinia enterocolitica]